MGNKVCCQETRTNSTLQKSLNQGFKHPIEIAPPKKVQTLHHPPQLTPFIEKLLAQKHFFKEEEWKQSNIYSKRYDQDLYIGSSDTPDGKPHGFGKMYKGNGCLYIGHFYNGKAHGKGVFIFADGSYYEGEFYNNQAQTLDGQYYSSSFNYRGGFRQNAFDGQGFEIGPEYTYEGEFSKGLRTNGRLSWNKNTCVYTGSFNENKRFHGKGTLIQPQGSYQGLFAHGEKEGFGVYRYANGSRYEGLYHQGLRQGKGTIYLKSGQIQFEGTLKKGLPDGKGKAADQSGKLVEKTFVQGIEANLLQK